MNRLLTALMPESRLLAVLAGGLLITTTAGADFTFNGREGFSPNTGPIVSGGLTLDLSDGGVVMPLAGGEAGSTAVYSSANNYLFGSYDLWTFSGVPEIFVSDTPAFWSGGGENYGLDYWIARTTVSGPTVSGWTPVFFGLYYYTSPGAITNCSLMPPFDPLTSANEQDLSFYLQLVDASDNFMEISGPVFSVQAVPEPTVFTLASLGIVLLATQLRRRKAARI